MNCGWIKQHRKFITWEWYDDTNTKVVFLHCLLKANFKQKKYRGKRIDRGQFVTGRKKFAGEVNLSVQQVRTAWEKLQMTGEITLKTTSVGTTITVCNFSTYQDSNNEDNLQNSQQTTSDQPLSNQQVTTTNKEKNVKKDKKNSRHNTPPSLQEVKKYFVEKGYPESLAETFFKYYQQSMEDRNGRVWKDSNGKSVKNWKQKAIGVWMKDENKIKDSNSILRPGDKDI